MSKAILGVDIAKRKFDVALLINGKLKHKVFTNNQEGFELLMAWLHKQERCSCPCLPGSIKYLR